MTNKSITKEENLHIKKVSLKEGAVFIADVHYKKGDEKFLSFLESLDENPPSQLFLLGDIFHLLLPFEYLINYNKEAVNLINSIAKKTEVYYAVGNHDFWLDGVFENVTVSDAFVDEKKSIFITHGDLNEKDFFYRIYLKIIRNKNFIRFLNIVSFNFLNNWLFKKILQKKVKCFKISSFKTKIIQKIADINYKMIIEGHYHQNVLYNIKNKTYINLGAFICDRSYYVFRENLLKEKKYE